MGDAEALRAWLAAAAADLGEAALRDAAAALLRSGSSLPPQLDTVPEALPQGPGVYVFHGDDTIPLYIGKAVNLRRRVLQHFQSDHADAREMRIAQQLRRVECIETVGEFGALLLEARLVKRWQPLYNRQLRRSGSLCSWQLADDAAERPQLWLVRGAVDAAGAELYGVYRSRRQAVEALRGLAERDALCLRALGLESGAGRCFAHQLGRCRGVCCGDESAQQHHERLRAALAEHRLQAWPWRGAIALRERGAGGSELHVFDDWRHLGSAPDEAGARALLAARQPLAFDLDTYRLLLTRLRGVPDVVTLD
ncbi:excinuclease cho [mine drainage metagenome]|uniref:Excinuclease cho n=1 Tax=mine drainage metagenome TaxID=410659 RepID=A0A1J5QKZ5_9ZZZZ